MQYPSYEQFKAANKTIVRGNASCSISNVRNLSSPTHATCDMTVLDNTTTVLVKLLVEDIYFNEMGITSNPSAIKNWGGWGKNI